MQKKIPMRQCVGCREMRPKKELVRVVKSPEGAISLDFRGVPLPEQRMPEKGDSRQSARTGLQHADSAGGSGRTGADDGGTGE